MMNIFSAIFGVIIFLEIVSVIALLKPFREPYYIRDVWFHLQDTYHPPKVLGILIFSLFLNTIMEISWEKFHYRCLLYEVNDPGLILEFYLSKTSICYTCFLMTLYLLVLIERIIQYLIMIARLLEFELMCRHAILSRDFTTKHSTTTLFLTNLYTFKANERVILLYCFIISCGKF